VEGGEVSADKGTTMLSPVVKALMVAFLLGAIYFVLKVNKDINKITSGLDLQDKQVRACVSSGGTPVMLYGFDYEGCRK
jgi:hypothetical protein